MFTPKSNTKSIPFLRL